jgi:hypothetical protein
MLIREARVLGGELQLRNQLTIHRIRRCVTVRRGDSGATHPAGDYFFSVSGCVACHRLSRSLLTAFCTTSSRAERSTRPGSVTASELATYVVEKAKPLVTLVK